MINEATLKKVQSGIPSVLASEKKIVLSDGFMYGTIWGERNLNSKVIPLKLHEKSVRGTISNRLKETTLNDPAKINAQVENPNLHTSDYCALSMNQDTLKLSFTIKILSGVETFSACNKEDFSKSYKAVAEKYIEEKGFKELARRYAINIANGRFFWRNRVGAEKVEVKVTIEAEKKNWTFNALDFRLDQFTELDFKVDGFEEKNKNVNKLAGLIADTLCGKKHKFLLIKVEAFALMGTAQEVYPSEELVMNKEKTKKKGEYPKSKILYAVDEVAAMHSQKIGNAIRTIDNWYPEVEEAGIGPIPIETYGSVTKMGRAYRRTKVDFYTLFDKYALGGKLDDEEQEHYVMAVLVRGGVFGESDKNE